MPIELSPIYSDVPVGDMAVVHPLSAMGFFQGDIPAGGSLTIRHEIMNGPVPDATITNNSWMSLITFLFSWNIIATQFDATLEVLANPTNSSSFVTVKTFLLKASVPHRIDSFPVPGANSSFVLHNSSGVATNTSIGSIRMRSM